MSNREKCLSIINTFTEDQLDNIVMMLNAMKAIADKAADDAFCSRLYATYQDDPDKGDPIDIDDFAKTLGVNL